MKLPKNMVVEFLNKVFVKLGSKNKLTPKDFSYALSEAAASNSYIETVSRKADSLHLKIKKCYEEDFIGLFKKTARHEIRKRRIAIATLAIDITEENFYGKTRNFYIHNWKGERGVNGKFKFIVLSIVKKEKIPIMATPLTVGCSKADCIRDMVKFSQENIPIINAVLLDRGFYSGSVIKCLQELKVKYLMFAPSNKAIMKYIDSDLNDVEHEIRYLENFTGKKVATKIVFSKYDGMTWPFATNLTLPNYVDYVYLYKNRWQIETNFRVEDEARIKTKSTIPIIRFFYFLIALLFHLAWHRKCQFKRMIIDMRNSSFCEMLGINYSA